MSWSGSFTNETFAGPGAYQAKNGVRCLIDMTLGGVTVSTPTSPANNSSFIIHWDNPNSETLTFTTTDLIQDLATVGPAVSSAAVTFRHGSVAFAFVDGLWEIFQWSLFGFSLQTSFAIQWVGRNTNGICVLLGEHQGVEVERTALGFYTVRLITGTLVHPTILIPAPFATGLPAETSPELRPEDVGMANPEEILINSGTRNKNGQFTDDDLIQDPANFMAIVGQRFP